MNHKPNFFNKAIALAGLTVATLPVLAACGSSMPLISGASGQYQNVVSMPGTPVHHLWVQGSGASSNAEACTPSTAFLAKNGLYQWSAVGSFNWQLACAAGCNLGLKTSVLTSGMDNNVPARAYFFVGSVLATASRTQMYDISNGQATTDGTTACTGGAACVMNKILIPVPSLQTIGNGATYNHAAGTGSIYVSFTLPFGAADVRNFQGYFSAGGQPAANYIAYELYQINGTSVPAAGAANWPGSPVATFTAADCSGAVCSKLVTVNAISGSNIGYFAIRPYVDAWTRSDFLAVQPSGISGPLAVEGLPTSIEAYNTKVGNLPGVQVRWTVTDDSTIAGYNVLASRDGSSFVKVNDRQIAPVGAGTYTQNITRRTLASKLGGAKAYLLKVQVVLKDGTTQDVGPTSYSFK